MEGMKNGFQKFRFPAHARGFWAMWGVVFALGGYLPGVYGSAAVAWADSIGSQMEAGSGCTGPLTYQGYDYKLVEIAGQCWFAENLRAVRYRNDDPIPGNLSANRWTALTSGAQAVYDEKESNLLQYGRLYNGYAVDDPRGLCPAGWHVPEKEEWNELIAALGGREVAGKVMKADPWYGPSSGGVVIPLNGMRVNRTGDYKDQGGWGYWWTASAYRLDHAWAITLFEGDDIASWDHIDITCGIAVRCLRDQ